MADVYLSIDQAAGNQSSLCRCDKVRRAWMQNNTWSKRNQSIVMLINIGWCAGITSCIVPFYLEQRQELWKLVPLLIQSAASAPMWVLSRCCSLQFCCCLHPLMAYHQSSSGYLAVLQKNYKNTLGCCKTSRPLCFNASRRAVRAYWPHPDWWHLYLGIAESCCIWSQYIVCAYVCYPFH